MKRLWFILAGVVFVGWQVFSVNRWGAEGVQGRMYVATAFIALVFMALYSRDPWQKSWFGRSLMLLALSIFLVGVSVILFRLYGPDYPLRPVLIVVTADTAFFAMLVRTLVLIGAQRNDEHKADPRP